MQTSKVNACVEQIGGKNNEDKNEWNGNKYGMPDRALFFIEICHASLTNLWECLDEPGDHIWTRKDGFPKGF